MKTITIEDLLDFIDAHLLYDKLSGFLMFNKNFTYDEARAALKQIGLGDELGESK
jgi:hypothetical protein